MIQTHAVSLPHGITLACRSVPAPFEGAPRVLLLHGFPEAAFVWDELMGLLAPHAHCVAPNLRGYPGSSAPDDIAAYRAKPLVQDVAALIAALTPPGAGALDLLVAHDWGGALAWNLAAQQPQLLKRLLIINSPHPATFLRELRHSPEQQAASAYMSFLCRPDAETLLAENGHARLLKFFHQPAWLTPALQQSYLEAWTYHASGLRGPLNYYRASPLRPATGPDDLLHSLVLPDAMVTVSLPTTVLWGEGDVALRPGLLQGLQQWVPQLDLRLVPEATHWLVHEQPERVAAVVRSLLG